MVTLTREQLERRLIALHRASLQLVGNLSRDNVLEQIVHIARDQANARFAALGILNEEGKLADFIHIGMEKEEIERIDHLPHGLGLLGAVLNDRQTIRIPHISADERSVGFPTHHPEMASFLGVPIMSGGQLLGQIYLTDKENALEFNHDDELVIQTLAAYAAVAIENSRLYQNVIQRDQTLNQQYEDLSLLYQLAQSLSKMSDVDQILGEILRQVIDHFCVQVGEVFLRDNENGMLRLAHHQSESDKVSNFWANGHFNVDECIVGHAAKEKKILVSAIADVDRRFLQSTVVEAGFQRLACIPLIANSKVIGVMTIASQENTPLTARQLNLLAALSTWAGTTIENARLQQKTRRIAILEERERIGMDLHDGIIQSIYGIGLGLDYARLSLKDDPETSYRKISEGIEGLNQSIRDLRAYISDLRPRQMHKGEALHDGIARLVEEFQTNADADIILTTSNNGLTGLPQKNAVTIFHICQESLANAAKHAHAETVEVSLWATDEQVLIKICDNGRGFDVESRSRALGHGLSNMHRRAHKVGGDVKISSTRKEGTIIVAWVPRAEEIAVPEV
ncbi:MAG: GAF domain-containing sensor histidine kinase [Anaerolineae bacterium]|nr:GAF domain-containing sensor histidine kinase [Anaerolineae bacterium]